MYGLAPLRPHDATSFSMTKQGVADPENRAHRAASQSGVFQHPLNFSVGNKTFKLDKFIVFTGVIDVAKTFT